MMKEGETNFPHVAFKTTLGNSFELLAGLRSGGISQQGGMCEGST